MSFFNTSGNSEFIKSLLNCYVNVLKFFVSLAGMLLTWHVFLISGKKIHSLYMYWMFIFCNSIKGGAVWSKLKQVLIVSLFEKNIFLFAWNPISFAIAFLVFFFFSFSFFSLGNWDKSRQYPFPGKIFFVFTWNAISFTIVSLVFFSFFPFPRKIFFVFAWNAISFTIVFLVFFPSRFFPSKLRQILIVSFFEKNTFCVDCQKYF